MESKLIQPLCTVAPGKNILKAVSVLFIAFNGFVVMLMLAWLLFSWIGWVFLDVIMGSLRSNMVEFITRASLLLIGAIYGVFVGAMGLMKCNDISKAVLLQILAMAHIILILATSRIMFFGYLARSIFGDGIVIIGSFSFASIIELVLPILFLFGATKNRIAYKKLQH